MANYSDATKLDKTWKSIFNKARGVNQVQFYEENIPTVTDVSASDIYAEEIPASPPASTSSIVKKWYPAGEGGDGRLVLTKDGYYNDARVWVVKGTWSANYSSGSAGVGDILKNFVSPKYGTGYVVRVYDGNDNPIPELDDASWLFDYKAGVLTFELPRGESGGTQANSIKIDVYQYVGNLVSDATSDERVKAQASDTTPGYLVDKVDDSTIEVDTVNNVMRVKDGGITGTKVANGTLGVGKLTSGATPAGRVMTADGAGNVEFSEVATEDELVKISSADTTAGYAEDKIVGTTNKTTVTKINTGGNEQLRVGIGTHVFDKTVDDTDDITEGTTNKFATTTVLNSWLGTKSTSDLSEGSNLYYTNTRVDNRIQTQSHTISGAYQFTTLPTSSIAPSANNQFVNKAYVDSVAQGQVFKGEVIAVNVNDPGTVTPSNGDKITVGPSPTGSLAGEAGKIATWNGSYSFSDAPADGWTVRLETDDTIWIYADNAWIFYTGGGATYLGGNGIDITGTTISVDLDTNSALTFSGGKLRVNDTIAGAGLGITDGVLDVNVDNTGIEVNADTLRLKDLGVTTGKINNLAVTEGKIADGAITEDKYADRSIYGIKIRMGTILNENIYAETIEAGSLASGSVTFPKIAALAFGQGINRNTVDNRFDVKIDDTTIGFTGSDAIEVKDASIGETKLDIGVGAGEVNTGVIPLGSPSAGDYSSGVTNFSTSTMNSDAVKELNEILAELAPANALTFASQNLTIFGSSTTLYGGRLSSSASAFYRAGLGAGSSVDTNTLSSSPILSDATFNLQTPTTTTRFAFADQGVLNIEINGIQVDTFNLGTAFNEAQRDGNQSYTPSTSANNKITVTSVGKYNNFKKWQKGIARVNIIPADLREGYNFIQLKHVIGATTYSSNIWHFFYDTDTGANPQIAGGNVTLNVGTINSSKYLSGVRFLSNNDTLQLSVTGNNLFNNVYVASDPLSWSGLTGVINGSISVTDGSIDQGQLSDPPAVGEVMAVSNKTLTINNNNVATNNARVTITPRDPYGTYTTAQSPVQNMLISTYADGSTGQSTTLNEYFSNEYYRLPTNHDFDSTSNSIVNQWTSSNALSNGNAQCYLVGGSTHGLVYPTINFSSGYLPTNTANYTSFTDNQVYVRTFTSQNNQNNVSITLYGVAAGINQLGSGDVNVEVKLPTQTGWLDCAKPWDQSVGVDNDGDGGLSGSISYSGGNATFNVTFGGRSTGDSGQRMYFRVTLRNTNRTITRVQINNW